MVFRIWNENLSNEHVYICYYHADSMWACLNLQNKGHVQLKFSYESNMSFKFSSIVTQIKSKQSIHTVLSGTH